MNALASRHAPGTVVRYQPDRSSHDPMWCREGLAIANSDGRLLDTFWTTGGEDHAVDDGEEQSIRVIANLNDYQRLARNADADSYHPNDRLTITRQHHLIREEYVRLGAEPHLGTRIRSQVRKVRAAESALASARSDVEWQRRKLDDVLAERVSS